MNDRFHGTDEPSSASDADSDEAMFADLGRFDTGAIPVDAVLKQGRAIRTRRRVIGSGALAIAAALSIGVPVAIAGGGSGIGAAGGHSGLYGASSTGGRVMLDPTPFSDGKGHFSGAVDGKKWSVDFDNENCYYILWSCGFQGLNPWDKYASLASNSSWGQQGQPDDYTLFLNKDVARVTITLQDGEVLRSEAVPVAKGPVALFALPFGLGVSKIELFDAQGGEIAYSLPFNIAGSASSPAQWYKPGDTPPTVTGSVELTRGDAGGGTQEVLSAYVGPSGPCIVTQMGGHPNATCSMLTLLTGSISIQSPVTISGDGAKTYGGEASYGLAAANIDHLQLDFSDGTKSLVPVKSLGGHRFYAYIVPQGMNLTGVTAFDAAGKALPAQKNAQPSGR